ncbi:MAG: alpha/beta hydrolase [Deltaproteobacteria bacterium]|nr:alpha/beta hydrolase [Deltaproteobacteria bacterium]
MDNHYAEEETTVISFDGIKLRGALTLPRVPHSLVITVHGSFNQDRNGDLDSSSKWMYPEGTPKRRLFYDMSVALAKVNVATFRYDKRASGESEGRYADVTLVVLAKDVKAIFENMRARFPAIPIWIIGQSEGCLVTLKTYELGTRPNAILLQSPPLVPFDKVLEHQKNRAAAPFLNDPTGELARKYPYVSAFYKAMYEGDMLRRIRMTNDQYYTLTNGQWTAVTSLQKYREYMWDGLEMLKKVHCPVKIFFGSKDLNVPPEVAQNIEAGKKEGLFQNVEVTTLANLEHSFRELAPGDGFFEALSKPLSPKYVTALQDLFKEGRSCPEALSGPQ